MATTKFKVGNKVKLVFSKERYKDLIADDGTVIISIGADDKEYTGEIEIVQDNGYCTVNFVKDGEERQVSIPSTELTKV